MESALNKFRHPSPPFSMARQLMHSVEDVGSHVKSSKKRVNWKFYFLGDSDVRDNGFRAGFVPFRCGCFGAFGALFGMFRPRGWVYFGGKATVQVFGGVLWGLGTGMDPHVPLPHSPPLAVVVGRSF